MEIEGQAQSGTCRRWEYRKFAILGVDVSKIIPLKSTESSSSRTGNAIVGLTRREVVTRKLTSHSRAFPQFSVKSRVPTDPFLPPSSLGRVYSQFTHSLGLRRRTVTNRASSRAAAASSSHLHKMSHSLQSSNVQLS